MPGIVLAPAAALRNLAGVQRLFSTFPRGAPGVGLLVLRVALGIAIWHAATVSPWILAIAGMCATALFLGLLTPWVAVLYVVLALVTWGSASETLPLAQGCTVVDAAVLAMLGPGGYSIDARLFGRQQIIVPNRDRLDDR